MQVVLPKMSFPFGPGEYKHTDWGLPVDQTVPRGIDAMAGSIKNEERFKDR